MQIVDRDSAMAFLLGRINHERKTDAPYRDSVFKLDRMRSLLGRLGDPHLRLPAVHIAGTKGKGSTAAMVAAALTASGRRTGLYTSPHLHALEERMAVDGEHCPSPEMVVHARRVAEVVEAMDAEADAAGDDTGRPTYFEATTAMAWLHFLAREVEIAVLEVGLGGRLDSTNLCRPIVSVITSISLDHVRQLGGTLSAIAMEKAGIIKPGTPVVSGVTDPEPAEVIERRAAECGSRLWRLGRDFDFHYRPGDSARQPGRLDYIAIGSQPPCVLQGLEVGLIGRHQAHNAAVAVCALARLNEAGWTVEESALRQGFREARCPARIEILPELPQAAPTVVLDVAHNVASMQALCATLQERFAGRPLRMVFAASNDKDVAGMLTVIWPHLEQIVLTQFRSNPRSVDIPTLLNIAGQVAETAGPAGPKVKTAPDAEEAWHVAVRGAGSGHVVCVCGSFFIAAEVRTALAAIGGLPAET